MKELRKLEGKRKKGKSIGERAPWTWKLEAEDIEKSIEERHPEAPFWPRTESQGSVAVVGGAGIGRFYDLVTLRKQLETLVRETLLLIVFQENLRLIEATLVRARRCAPPPARETGSHRPQGNRPQGAVNYQ